MENKIQYTKEEEERIKEVSQSKKINQEVKDKMVDLHKQGFSIRGIAKILNIGRSVVFRHLKEHNKNG